MNLKLKAGFVTLLVGVIIGFGFYSWKKSAFTSDDERHIDQLNKMETDGLIDFVGFDLNGKQFRLSDFKGKVVILNFWASWCGPCVEEFPSMLKLIERMKGDVVLIAVSQDSSKEEILAFLKAFPAAANENVHIVTDLDRTIGRKYNADRLPESYIGNRKFNLERKIVGSIDWATEDAVEYMKKVASK